MKGEIFMKLYDSPIAQIVPIKVGEVISASSGTLFDRRVNESDEINMVTWDYTK